MHRRYKNVFIRKTSRNDQQLKQYGGNDLQKSTVCLCTNNKHVWKEIMNTHSFTIASKKMVIIKMTIQLKAIYRFNADK